MIILAHKGDIMNLNQKIRILAASVLLVTTASTALADTYTKTKYPIVLVHGMLGFDTIGPVNYWWGIPGALRSGGATVYQPQVSATNGNEIRGEQLLAQLRQIQAQTGVAKFNLVAHSQGGITARYVLANAPELVASVLTVGSPHGGSPVADGVLRDVQAAGVSGLAFDILSGLGTIISYLSGQPKLPQDAYATFNDTTVANAAAFNARYPVGIPTTPCGQGTATAPNGAKLYSASGTAPITNLLDPVDSIMGLMSTYFKGAPSDGMVGQCSSHFGAVLKDNYAWNHMDEVNQTFGVRGLFTPDPVAFYRTHANRLKSAGL